MVAKRASGAQKSKKQLNLLDLKGTWFHVDGKRINVEDASDAEFDQFIRQHVQVCWSLEERRDSLNLALEQGQTLVLTDGENQDGKELKSKANQD